MNVEQIETALSSTKPADITRALEFLYAPSRSDFAIERNPIKTRWSAVLVGGLVLAIGMGLWNRAAASGERAELRRALSIVPGFFAAVEDSGNRTEVLAASLVSLPAPEYAGNRRLWAQSMIEVNALLAVQSAKGGRWELSQVYEQQARDFLDGLQEPSLLSQCIVEYAECRRRHEQALSGFGRDWDMLRANVEQLDAFLGSCPNAATNTERVAIARLAALAGISGYKGGHGDWLAFFSDAKTMLLEVPVNERDKAWLFAYARMAADRSLNLVQLDKFDESRELLDGAIEQLADLDEPYLTGLLFGNRADVSLVERSVSDGDIQSMLEREISDRMTAITELSRPLADGSSVNQTENETLHRARLVVSLANAGRLEEALSELGSLEDIPTVNDAMSFWNPQLHILERAAIGLTIACDKTRSDDTRRAAFLRAMGIVRGLANETRGQRLFVSRRLGSFLLQLPEADGEVLAVELTRFEPGSE